MIKVYQCQSYVCLNGRYHSSMPEFKVRGYEIVNITHDSIYMGQCGTVEHTFIVEYKKKSKEILK